MENLSKFGRVFNDYWENKSKIQIILISLLCVLATGFLEWLFPPEVELSIFCLFPAAFAAWYVNKEAGYIVSILGIAVWITADLSSASQLSHLVFLLNSLAIFFGFILAVTLLANLKLRLKNLAEINETKKKFWDLARWWDFRNALTRLDSYVNQSLDDSSVIADEKRINYLKKMEKVCKNMAAATDDLFDPDLVGSEKIRINSREIELTKYLQNIYDDFLLLMKAKGIKFEMERPKQTAKVWFDPKLMYQVFTELLSNAVQYSFPKSTITLGAEIADHTLQFFIKDHGLGLTEEEKTEIFTDHEELKNGSFPVGKRKWPGLTITRRVIEAHGGRMWLESNIGVGTTVTFFLPMEPTSDQTLEGL
ncbi:MAG: HAMP domain-containing sensor histidine kinase [bacterium]|nr:HAMP domain-containing sensor histidine kinase [bacterium]